LNKFSAKNKRKTIDRQLVDPTVRQALPRLDECAMKTIARGFHAQPPLGGGGGGIGNQKDQRWFNYRVPPPTGISCCTQEAFANPFSQPGWILSVHRAVGQPPP